MDETLKNVEFDLFKLENLYEEIDEVNLNINKLKSINNVDLDGDFYGSSLKAPLTAELQANVEYLENLLVENTQKGLFKPKNYIKKPDYDVNGYKNKVNEYKKKIILAVIVTIAEFLGILFIGGMICLMTDENIMGIYLAVSCFFLFIGAIVILALILEKYSLSNEYNKYLENLNNYKRIINKLPSEYKNDIYEKANFIVNTAKAFKEQKDKKISKMEEYIKKLNVVVSNITQNSELPYHYAINKNAVSLMLNIILSKRADTLKEMINIYERDCKLNIIISEIQKSNKIYLQSMQEAQLSIANCTELISSDMKELKAIASAPIQITGTSTTYTYDI